MSWFRKAMGGVLMVPSLDPPIGTFRIKVREKDDEWTAWAERWVSPFGITPDWTTVKTGCPPTTTHYFGRTVEDVRNEVCDAIADTLRHERYQFETRTYSVEECT